MRSLDDVWAPGFYYLALRPKSNQNLRGNILGFFLDGYSIRRFRACLFVGMCIRANECSLLGVRRTSRGLIAMSANDPKQPF